MNSRIWRLPPADGGPQCPICGAEMVVRSSRRCGEQQCSVVARRVQYLRCPECGAKATRFVVSYNGNA